MSFGIVSKGVELFLMYEKKVFKVYINFKPLYIFELWNTWSCIYFLVSDVEIP